VIDVDNNDNLVKHCYLVDRQICPAIILCGRPSALEPVTSCYMSH